MIFISESNVCLAHIPLHEVIKYVSELLLLTIKDKWRVEMSCYKESEHMENLFIITFKFEHFVFFLFKKKQGEKKLCLLHSMPKSVLHILSASLI